VRRGDRVSSLRVPRLLRAPCHAHPGAGRLYVLNAPLPFVPCRLFWINAPRGAVRARHAHRTNEQVVALASGSMTARCVWWVGGRRRTRTWRLVPGQAVYLPALVWLEMRFATPGVCVVLASEPYDASSYIDELVELRRLS
jgi:uncharacterized RmlC-like cupin family protein